MNDDRVNRIQYRGMIFKSGLRYTNGGKAIGEARMFVSRNFAKKGEEKKYESAWFGVTAWEQAGEVLGDLPDRAEITVSGRLDVDRGYTTKDGTVVEPRLKITADEVIVHSGGGQPREAPQKVAAADVNYDEIPF